MASGSSIRRMVLKQSPGEMNVTPAVWIMLWQGQVFLCRFNGPVATVRLILMTAGLAGEELEGEGSAEKKGSG